MLGSVWAPAIVGFVVFTGWIGSEVYVVWCHGRNLRQLSQEDRLRWVEARERDDG